MVATMISTNQGATTSRHRIRPGSGFNPRSQPEALAWIASARLAKAGTIGVIGPLTRNPTPSAAQKIPARRHCSAFESASRPRAIQWRASTPMAAAMVAATMASVLASRASTPSRMVEAMSMAAISAAPSPTSASAAHQVSSTVATAPIREGSRKTQIFARASGTPSACAPATKPACSQ